MRKAVVLLVTLALSLVGMPPALAATPSIVSTTLTTDSPVDNAWSAAGDVLEITWDNAATHTGDNDLDVNEVNAVLGTSVVFDTGTAVALLGSGNATWTLTINTEALTTGVTVGDDTNGTSNASVTNGGADQQGPSTGITLAADGGPLLTNAALSVDDDNGVWASINDVITLSWSETTEHAATDGPLLVDELNAVLGTAVVYGGSSSVTLYGSGTNTWTLTVGGEALSTGLAVGAAVNGTNNPGVTSVSTNKAQGIATGVALAAPTITSINPDEGPEAGATEVTITGTNLTGATNVTFDGTSAASFTVDSATQITATTPAGTAGAVDVVVVHPGGNATEAGGFTYLANDADLSNLIVSQGTLDPAFDTGTTSYTASVANSVAAIDVTPTVADPAASLKVNGTASPSGDAKTVALSVGDNTITIVVTAEDGTTTKTYTVTVTRAAASGGSTPAPNPSPTPTPTPTPTPEPEGTKETAPVTPPSNPETPAETEVTLPAGTVSVSIKGLTDSAQLTVIQRDDPPVSGGFQLLGAGFEVTLTGAEFDSAEVCFPYDEDAAAAAGLLESEIQLFHVNDQGQPENVTSSIDTVNNLICGVTSSFSPFMLGVENVSRLAGPNRVSTAAAISAARFERGVPVAFVTTGDAFPDSLAGGPAAAKLGAPLLLTSGETLPEATREELRRLRPGRIVVLGGTGAVPDAVAAELAALTSGNVERWSDADRFGTAAAISRAAFPNGADTVYIATGENFPDALAGGAAAAVAGAPVLLVTADVVPDSTVAELERLAPSRIVVLGGTGAVSEAVIEALGGYAENVSRVSGSDRFATAAAVSSTSFEAGAVPVVFLATGAGFADALAGVPAAALSGAPILLVEQGNLPEATRAELRRLGAPRVVILGSTGAVGQVVEEAVRTFVD